MAPEMIHKQCGARSHWRSSSPGSAPVDSSEGHSLSSSEGRLLVRSHAAAPRSDLGNAAPVVLLPSLLPCGLSAILLGMSWDPTSCTGVPDSGSALDRLKSLSHSLSERLSPILLYPGSQELAQSFNHNLYSVKYKRK